MMCAKPGSRWLLLLLVVMTSCSYYNRGVQHTYPSYEPTAQFDTESFVAYLDTAAIDDWEGLWLMIGPDQHCYLIIERINTTQRNNYYTHCLRTWQPWRNWIYTEPPGTIMGYLEQGMYDDVKRITIFNKFLGWREEYDTTVQLDATKSRIVFKTPAKVKVDFSQVGMIRLYPIRSREEERSGVRYL